MLMPADRKADRIASNYMSLMQVSIACDLFGQLQAAAENDLLDDVVHRRANASLSFFAATNVFVTLLTFVPNPVYPHAFINPPAAIGLEALSAFQWWVAGRNYAKYSEGIGANPIKIIQVSICAWALHVLQRLTDIHVLSVCHSTPCT